MDYDLNFESGPLDCVRSRAFTDEFLSNNHGRSLSLDELADVVYASYGRTVSAGHLDVSQFEKPPVKGLPKDRRRYFLP